MSRSMLASIGLLCLSACGGGYTYVPPAPLLADEGTFVETELGPVIGGREENGAKAWLGLPYAAPPTGKRRWRAPMRAMAWATPRHTLNHPAWCPQMTNGLDGLFGLESGEIRGDEDCLYLDIYAPSGATIESELPVMVWVHGGSNVWGRAEQYDGSRLAEQEDVIVIVIQYRLGPLGWFSHPSLRAEGQPANFALLDIIAALGWVNENIAAFGGDPDKVSLFGESAGAHNILALLAMPEADGLYRAAIAQSGLPLSLPREASEEGDGARILGAISAAEAFTGRSDASPDQLRSVPFGQIVGAYAGRQPATVIQDGLTLPDLPLDEAIAAHQAGHDIPIILGSNRDEAKYLLAFDKSFTKRAFGIFPQSKDKDHYNSVDNAMSSMWRLVGVDRFARTLAASNTGPVYTYRFDWDEQGKVGLSDMSDLIGAAHSLEIPFVFGRFNSFMGRLDERMFNKSNQPGRTVLSDAMMSYWGAIARSGAPDKGEEIQRPVWQPVDEGGSPTLIFDTEDGGGIRLAEEPLVLESLLRQIEMDEALTQDNRRCRVAQQIEQFFGRDEPVLASFAQQACMTE